MRDFRRSAVAKLWTEIRQPARHDIVEAELAVLDQGKRRRRDDRLGEGGEAEDRVRAASASPASRSS